MHVLTDQITETVAPTAYPVTLVEAKAHLRVDISDDDTLITSMIAAATDFCEAYTGRSFVPRTYRADLRGFYFGNLPKRPIISISSVKYYDTGSPETLTTWAATNYQLVNDILYWTEAASIPAYAYRADAIQITYTAGYAPTSSPEDPAESVPTAIKAAILMIIGDLYENREAKITGLMQTENYTVMMLLSSYRVYQ